MPSHVAKHFLDISQDNYASPQYYASICKKMQDHIGSRSIHDLRGRVFATAYLKKICSRAGIYRVSQGSRDERGKPINREEDTYNALDKLVYGVLARALYDATANCISEKGKNDTKNATILERHVVKALENRKAIGVGDAGTQRIIVNKKLK